jgi:HAE1 family hydrophobic/amphiphilic exporter-1
LAAAAVLGASLLLLPLIGSVPGMKIRTRAPQGQFILERLLGGDDGLTVEIRGYELATLDPLSGSVAKLIVDVPGITDVQTSLEAGIPQQEIRVNRDKVADLGLSVRYVTQLLQTAVAGSKAGEYRTGGNSYRIQVQLKDAEKRSLNEILNLTLTTVSGEKVALRNLVTTAASRGPILIDRKDQQRRVTVSANVAGRDLGSVALDVQALLDQIPRPILMTTLTTILGLLPLALGIGEGSDAQAPLARAVVGGLTGSTLITLVLIPVVYSLFHPEAKKR